MEAIDPAKIVPKRGWIVALADERQETTSGGIILPGQLTGVERVTEGTGTIITVGPGEKNAALGLEPGEKICYRGFVKFAHRISAEEYWPSGVEKHYFFMDSDDILGIVPSGVSVGVFSGRPEVPSKE